MTATPAPPTRAALRDHLVAARIAGAVQTGRDNNLANIRKMLDRHEEYHFGLTLARPWTYDEVLALLADRVGISPDPTYRSGVDTIDPDRTLDALDAMAARLRKAAEGAQRVIVATGHPGGILAIHLEVAAALRAAGCPVLTPAEGHGNTEAGEYREVRYLGGVAMVSDRGGLRHTHRSWPMEAMLGRLIADGQPPPDLVVADHGWCGGAAEAGIDAVGFADCNDPALFVGEADGKVAVAVPLDDNVLPLNYAPLSAYLLPDLR